MAYYYLQVRYDWIKGIHSPHFPSTQNYSTLSTQFSSTAM